MLIDFHSHFLPGIDDGAQTVEIGTDMLCDAASQGVVCSIATPHYYPGRGVSVCEAIAARDDSYNRLVGYATQHGAELPRILRGFEVAYDDCLIKTDNLHDLCIEGTDYLLLEMPYGSWHENIVENVYDLSISGVKIVLAHMDRYYHMMGKSIFDLLSLGFPVQLNAEAFMTMHGRRFVKMLLDAGRTCVVGSDMHNMTVRPCDIGHAYEIAEKKFAHRAQDLFYYNAHKLLLKGGE